MLVEYAAIAKQLRVAIIGFAERNLLSSRFMAAYESGTVFPDKGIVIAHWPVEAFRQFAGSARPRS